MYSKGLRVIVATKLDVIWEARNTLAIAKIMRTPERVKN